MAKQLIKRFLPNPQKIQQNKYLRIFGNRLYSPGLWHLNRHSVATAFSIGLFITYIPFPGHMLLAALIAVLLRANLAISVTLVWVVNPLTMIPMFAFAYGVGALLMGFPLQELEFESWRDMLQGAWQPFLLGCLLCGTLLATTGNLFVRLFWRYTVAKNWRKRHLRRT